MTWEVELVKDNGKRLTIGTVVAARPLAAEGLARANRLAEAVAERSDSEARLAALPEEAPEAPEEAVQPEPSRSRRRRRMVRAGSAPPEVSDD